MLVICVICKYDVKITNRYSYINEYGDFSEQETKSCETITGEELIGKIKHWLNDGDVWEFVIRDNTIYISCFCPNSGETHDIKIEYLESKKENNYEGR